MAGISSAPFLHSVSGDGPFSVSSPLEDVPIVAKAYREIWKIWPKVSWLSNRKTEINGNVLAFDFKTGEVLLGLPGSELRIADIESLGFNLEPFYGKVESEYFSVEVRKLGTGIFRQRWRVITERRVAGKRLIDVVEIKGSMRSLKIPGVCDFTLSEDGTVSGKGGSEVALIVASLWVHYTSYGSASSCG